MDADGIPGTRIRFTHETKQQHGFAALFMLMWFFVSWVIGAGSKSFEVFFWVLGGGVAVALFIRLCCKKLSEHAFLSKRLFFTDFKQRI